MRNEPHQELQGFKSLILGEDRKAAEDPGSSNFPASIQGENKLVLGVPVDRKVPHEMEKQNEDQVQSMAREINEIRQKIDWLKKQECPKFAEFGQQLDQIEANLKGPLREKVVALKGKKPATSLIAWYGGIGIPKQAQKSELKETNEVPYEIFPLLKDVFTAEVIQIWNDLQSKLNIWKDEEPENGEIMGLLVCLQSFFLFKDLIQRYELILPPFLKQIQTFVPEVFLEMFNFNMKLLAQLPKDLVMRHSHCKIWFMTQKQFKVSKNYSIL
ncbi:hypothetical protein PGTUg99_017453 [Puccinia graminis f. sp. tritici]|uniref:Uncharacterized protein n=1 Tax=Puccinia graminis f. sp. tritici TaxID=56615 RepID=A0A5B0PJC4_PUCGR|nr:hypothetical protein PGTUg99_017453 [Puccinia graminis f. sp. tritici]